ncbi:MAG: hypothetical protein SGPRY_004996, partial [Prymnesium sp.]
EDDVDKVTQLARTGRISSADVYHLGTVTSNKVHDVLAERARVRKEADDEKKKMRANERDKDSITSHAAVKSLSRQELLAVLHCVDNARKKEHMKMKNKAEMMDYVVKLFPDLPADGPVVVPRAVGRVNGGRRARKRRRQVASESEELDESDESNHPEEYEDTERVHDGQVIQVAHLQVARNQKDELQQALLHENSSSRKLKNRVGKTVGFTSRAACRKMLHPDRGAKVSAAEEMHKQIKEQRRQGRRVIDDRWLCINMRKIIRESYGCAPDDNFKASYDWL